MQGTEIMDTRDLHERLEELREQRELSPAENLPPEDAEELAELETMEADISDWPYGETLIPEDGFEDYARELAEDTGAISSDAQWPLSYIDWPRAAEALRMDYTPHEYQGTTYYARS